MQWENKKIKIWYKHLITDANEAGAACKTTNVQQQGIFE